MNEPLRDQEAASRVGRLPDPLLPPLMRRPLPLVPLARACLLLCLLAGCAGPGGAEPARREKVRNFPNWERVIAAEAAASSFSESALANWPGQRARAWRSLRESLGQASLKERAEAVNHFFNQVPFGWDKEIWGRDNHWATPSEFMDRGGDCEDYAIAKYYALRRLGVPADSLRVAAVWDRQRREGHAVLLVLDHGVPLVLDNLVEEIRPLGAVPDYRPQFYVNEDFLWRLDG